MKMTLAAMLVFLTTGAVLAAEPTAEEQQKAEERAELQKDRAQMQATDAAERARLTPDIRQQAKTLAERDYPSGEAAVKAAVAGKHRKPGNAARDKYRHPVETLKFLG